MSGDQSDQKKVQENSCLLKIKKMLFTRYSHGKWAIYYVNEYFFYVSHYFILLVNTQFKHFNN